MIRSAALCLMFATPVPALAACLDGSNGALPMKATFNSGAVVEVLDRQADALTYRATVVDSGQTTEMTVQAGLFTLTANRGDGPAVFDWSTPLPGVADLVPGATFHAEAMLTSPGLPPRPFVTDVVVMGAETVAVGDCVFPVVKVLVKNAEGGKPMAQVFKWLHLPSQITLRSLVVIKGQMRPQYVTALE